MEVITKEQQGLVEIRNVGTWIIHRCLNCSIYTHAVHREYGAALVLININMIVSTCIFHKMFCAFKSWNFIVLLFIFFITIVQIVKIIFISSPSIFTESMSYQVYI